MKTKVQEVLASIGRQLAGEVPLKVEAVAFRPSCGHALTSQLRTPTLVSVIHIP